MMYRIMTLFLLIWMALTQTQAQGIDFFHGSWDEALEEAKRTKKVIFVDAYAVWCGPCKRMARNVFSNDRVGDFYNANFINMKLDMERGEGLSFRKKYPVTAFPTLYYIDGHGEVVYSTKGARGIDDFIDMGKMVLGSVDNSKEFADRYEAGERDPQLIYDYVVALNEAGKSSLKVANEYLDGQSNYETDFNLKFIFEATTEADSRIFDLLIQYRDQIEMIYSPRQVRDRIEKACYHTLDKAMEFQSLMLLEEAKNKMQNYHPEKADDFELEAEVEYWMRHGSSDDFAKAAQKYAKKVIADDPEKLLSLAQDLQKHHPNHAKAMKVAEKTAAKAARLGQNTNMYVTYAQILRHNGKDGKAIKMLEQALALADTSQEKRVAEEYLKLFKQ